MMIKSFLPRAIAGFLILQGPIWIVADSLAPAASSSAYESIFSKVAEHLNPEAERTTKHLADLAQRYNVAWLSLADKTKKVEASTRPASMPAANQDASRVLETKFGRFVEISQPIGKGENLSVGFRCPSLTDALFSKQILPGQLAYGTTLVATFLNLLLFLALYLAFLGIPLAGLLKKLSSGQELPEQFPPYVSGELEEITRGVKSGFSVLKEEHDKTISAARSDLSGVFAKEVDERLANRLAKEIVLMQSSDEACELTAQRLTEEFPSVVKAGFGIEHLSGGKIRAIGCHALNEEQIKNLSGLNESRFAAVIKKITSIGYLKPDELADKRLEQLTTDLSCDKCLIVPIVFNGIIRAHILLFANGKDTATIQKLDRTVKRVAEQIAPLWHLVANFEEAYHLSRFDYLTNVRNRLYLEDTISHMAKEPAAVPSSEKERVFMIFEGDNFRVIRGSYGPRTIDRLIQELAQELLNALDMSVRFKKVSARIKFADFFYRISGCRFILMLEDANLKKAVEMAEAVIQTVAERKDWAHGVPSWSVSCGISTLKQSSPADCLEEVMITLDYIRSRKQIGVVMLSKDVPPEYMSRALSLNTGGTMAVFDPVAILQTQLQAQKTGILTVNSPGGKVFWAYLENGKILKARLGKLCGDAALVEFICEFLDGTYRLQDISTLTPQASDEVKNLGGAYLVSMPINELIDYAVKTKESAEAAKTHLKTPDMIVHPTVERQAGLIENAYYKAGKTSNKLNLEITNNLWELCNGRFSFDEIIGKMQDEYPIAIVWAASDFLAQAKLIKYSRLRVSTHTDGSADQQSAASKAASVAASNASAPQTTGYVATPRICVACRTVDPLSQKFCVHCGAEMIPV